MFELYISDLFFLPRVITRLNVHCGLVKLFSLHGGGSSVDNGRLTGNHR